MQPAMTEMTIHWHKYTIHMPNNN